MKTYVVATIKDWNLRNFQKIAREIEANWHLITRREDLTPDKMAEIKPRYIFFPHWSWIIPREIYSNFECVVFHMTDLPFGRGGSPLQNLIVRGIYETKISALKVVEELDAGPVYLKRSLSLHGSAEEIFIRASDIVFDMIGYIIEKEPSPVEQRGKAVVFNRRTTQESRIPDIKDLRKVFDHIRMLDAEDYPRAFLETENLRLEFSRASLLSGCLLADVKITLKTEQDEQKSPGSSSPPR